MVVGRFTDGLDSGMTGIIAGKRRHGVTVAEVRVDCNGVSRAAGSS
jgi:hypothetical protein